MHACRAQQCKKLRKELSFPRHGRINHQLQQGLWRTEKEQYEKTELAGYRKENDEDIKMNATKEENSRHENKVVDGETRAHARIPL